MRISGNADAPIYHSAGLICSGFQKGISPLMKTLFRKLVSASLSPLRMSERLQTVLGIIAVLLMRFTGSSVAIFIYHCSAEIVLPAAVLLGFVLIRFRLCQTIFRIPAAAYILSLYVGYTAQNYMKLSETVFGELIDLMLPLLFFFNFIAFSVLGALFFGILLRFLSDGSPHAELFPRTYLVSCVLLFTSTLFLASESFLSNSDSLLYIYIDFAPHYLFLTFVGAWILTAFICCLREKLIHILTRCMTGLLLCIYCQYMFMNRSLPILDAVAQTAWNPDTGACIGNAVIWILLFSLPFLTDLLKKNIRKKIPDLHMIAAAFLGTIQMISLTILLITGKNIFSSSKAGGLDPSEQFVISKNKNAIVLVLDMLDQKLFEQIYADDPDTLSFLNDFTYYTNTSMPYDSTYHSIIAMLTHAQTYPKDDISDWYQEICSAEPSQRFFSRLHENQYIVHMYGQFIRPDFSALYGCADNVTLEQQDNYEIDKADLYASLNDMILYRAAPLVVKQLFTPTEDFGNNAVHYRNRCKFFNNDYLNALNLELSASEQPYFILQHIDGVHAPIEEIPGKLEVSIRILKEYIRQIKELGAYDDALIIVTADHGIHAEPENMPIWYIKQPHESHADLQYCSAPIALTDLPATVLDVMGMTKEGDEAVLGRPISQIAEDEVRERLVFQRKFFCDASLIPWTRYNADSYYGAFFGYYYTGTKEDLGKRELVEPPDILLETDSY